ncbi:hypothetical protein [Bacillus mycoides]|uniref:hypothetical protein n=1 Tax=Bacillus mycoides TaxID=1405 RepID=UPI0037FEE028
MSKSKRFGKDLVVTTADLSLGLTALPVVPATSDVGISINVDDKDSIIPLLVGMMIDYTTLAKKLHFIILAKKTPSSRNAK